MKNCTGSIVLPWINKNDNVCPSSRGAPFGQDKNWGMSLRSQVLSDPEKRHFYDQHGEEGLKLKARKSMKQDVVAMMSDMLCRILRQAYCRYHHCLCHSFVSCGISCLLFVILISRWVWYSNDKTFSGRMHMHLRMFCCKFPCFPTKMVCTYVTFLSQQPYPKAACQDFICVCFMRVFPAVNTRTFVHVCMHAHNALFSCVCVCVCVCVSYCGNNLQKTCMVAGAFVCMHTAGLWEYKHVYNTYARINTQEAYDNMDPSMVAAAFAHSGWGVRICVISTITIIFGILLLFPIFLILQVLNYYHAYARAHERFAQKFSACACTCILHIHGYIYVHECTCFARQCVFMCVHAHIHTRPSLKNLICVTVCVCVCVCVWMYAHVCVHVNAHTCMHTYAWCCMPQWLAVTYAYA